jgi:hypothetical protein
LGRGIEGSPGMGFQSFEIIGPIEQIETIAAGKGIRELANLHKLFGRGNWRKLKGLTTVQFANGIIAKAEVHWYEAHGIGRRKMKLKRFWIHK